jgi:uncharacterized phage protein gp47/JayE
LYAPIQVIRVGLKSDTDDYVKDLDYSILNNTISWAPYGAEPNPGQAYYITYKYNPTQFLKDFTTIVEEIRTDFGTLLPNLDISKSASRDLFVNVPARQYTDEYNALRHIYLIQSLQNVNELTDAELDAIGVNYSKARLPATKASGFALYSNNVARGYDVVIPIGTKVGTQPSLTNNQQITFVTTEERTLLHGTTSIIVPIEAETAGMIGNVSANTINIKISTVDVDAVINSLSTTGGSDEEGNEDYAKRLINVFKARNIATPNGIRELVLAQPNVIDSYIADVNNPVMLRDNGLGGKVDIYIQSESGFEAQTSDSYTYNGTDHVFLLQPVIANIEVAVTHLVNPPAILDPSNYTLIKDTGLLANSTKATDKLHIISGAVVGDIIDVNYVYNKLFNDIQDLMDSDAYHVAGIDVLVRSALETFIDVTGSIKLATGYVFTDVQTSIINQLTNYIEAKEIGSQIVYGDIINIIHDTPGVADLTPLALLSRRTESTASTVNLLGNEYPRAGNIIIRQMP